MRGMFLALGLLFAVAALLYGGGIAFLSSLSKAVAPPGAHGSGTATAVQTPAPPDHGPAGQALAISPITLVPSLVPQPSANPAPEDSSPMASEQRVLRSRRALETVDPKELLRQGGLAK